MDFFHFGLTDFIDILAVAILLYYLYRVLRRSRSLNVFIGIMIFLIAWLIVSQVLNMRLMGGIMNSLTSVGLLAIIVIFQDEIRKFFYTLGANRRVKRFFGLFHNEPQDKNKISKEQMLPVVMACMNMSKQKVGALIVVEREQKLDDIVQMGDFIDARINQRLIENIFFKNSPLHDGAMIISGDRIKAAACVLPVSHNYDIPKELGLRHRSAMGVSQESDAIAIVVSEETGRIAACVNGQFHLRLSSEQLESLLTTHHT